MLNSKTNAAKRVSAFLLAVLMLVGTLPLNVLAEGMQNKATNTVVADTKADKEPTTGSKKHTIHFNSNGGSGEMKDVEVADGETYSLPKNQFKAPEGKEFKNWLIEKDEFKEGHKLVVKKDLEVKANWEELKVSPVKKAFSSLLGKNNDGIEISDAKVPDAVMAGEGEYTGPAHNSVTSSDGKVQIRNFEVFWAGTDEDTIIHKHRWEDSWYEFFLDWRTRWGNDYPPRPNLGFSYIKDPTFSSDPKIQINWALSGEKIYNKGDMEINLPLLAYHNDEDFGFKITSYSIPKVVFNEDGSVNYNADYGNATLAYYYDKESKSTKIINIIDLAPGASGTLTLTYGNFDGNVRYLKDSEIATFQPTLNLKYDNETLTTKDRELKIKLETLFDAKIFKSGRTYTKWQNEWGDDLKPKNPDDFIYVLYEVESQVDDTLQTNLDVKFADSLGDVYCNGKKVDAEQEIIAYSKLSPIDIERERYRDSYYNTPYKLTDVPIEKSKIEFPSYNLNLGENEDKKNNLYRNKYIYYVVSIPRTKDKFHPAYKAYRSNVLVKVSKEKLGFKETKSAKYEFKNGATLKVSPNNSNQERITKNIEYTAELNYIYYPKVYFTAPTGNHYSLEKKSIERGYFAQNSDEEINRFRDKYKNLEANWRVECNARMLYQTYDSKKGEKNDIKAYGQKEYTLETVDDYLYLADDYKTPLTSNDYEVYSVMPRIEPKVYEQYNETSKFYYENTNAIIPTKILARKEATGEWIEMASFDYDSSGKTFDKRALNFKALYPGVELKDGNNFKFKNISKEYFDLSSLDDFYLQNYLYQCKGLPLITIPSGFTSVKMQNKTNAHGLDTQLYVNATLKISDRVKSYIDSTYKMPKMNDENDLYEFKIKLRNDATLVAYDEKGNIIGIKGTTPKHDSVEKTLALDKVNYGTEMYHDAAYINFEQLYIPPIPDISRRQELYKYYTEQKHKRNDIKNKMFLIDQMVSYREDVNYIKNEDAIKSNFHIQDKGTFYDLLPLGVTGVKDVKIESEGYREERDGYWVKKYYYIDKNTKKPYLNTKYKLIPNWRNSGRTLMIVSFDNADLVNYKYSYNKDSATKDKKGSIHANSGIVLNYTMIYPWDSYKDYGSKLERNLVAYESGFEKQPDGALNENLTSELEGGYRDSNPGYKRKYNYKDKKYYEDKHDKLFTDQEIEWMKDLNPNHDEKRFLYAHASTDVNGDTEANVGLTKHVSTDKNPNFTMKSTAMEGGNYQYKIRLQAAHGTSVSNLVFFDSIENYDPLEADEDYGVKRWKGTLSSIDLNHPIMKGVDPKIYVSTTPKLDIEKHNDVSDSSIWTLYKEGDDLSNVQAVAIDLRKNKDGSDFKLEQDTAINVYLNMKAPWNLKEKQIDPKAKALNAIYASNTVTANLGNHSTKLIYTAYTAVDLEPVIAEAPIKATKKHLDKEGKDIALKGNEFTFELQDSTGKVLQTKTNDDKGNISFEPMKYNSWDVGEHTYKIVEVKGNSDTTAYDNHEEIVKVKVERSGASELKATVIYDDEDGALFTNREVDPAGTAIEAKKIYIGKGGLEEKPKAGAFEFILKDAQGNEVGRTTNDAEGKVAFKELTYKPNQLGEHKYTIEEVKGNNPAIDYDTTKKNVTVNVSLTEDFKLKADVVYEGGTVPTFTNTLKSASLQLVKLKDESNSFVLEEVKDTNGFVTSYKVPEAQKGNVLDGAEYKLYKIESDGTETFIDTLITNAGISQVVQDILPGKYKLKETKAPEGYLLNAKDLEFEITEKDAGTIVAKFATDDKIEDMPSTGGQGTEAFMIGGGILLMTMAGVAYVANRRKEQRSK